MLLAAGGVIGCTPGINWRGVQYEPVLASARRDQKPMMLYFRNWADLRCTRFEENVLKTPAVLEATKSYYCVALDHYWNRALADGFGVQDPPGIVLVNSRGEALAKLSGEISAAALLAELRRESASQPGSNPAGTALPKSN